MCADETGRPDVASIAARSRAMVASGEATREAALEALRAIEEGLRRDLGLMDEALAPITQLIAELRAGPSGDPQCGRPGRST
jgi:hypothetical protein